MDQASLFDISEFTHTVKKKPAHEIDLIYSVTVKYSCCLAELAGLKYGLQSGKSLCLQGHEVTFVDNDFKKYDHQKHLEFVKQTKPKYATVRDIMTEDQCQQDGIIYYSFDQIMTWAQELNEYARNVIVIPKYDCLDKIPENYVLGYSVLTSYGGTPMPIDIFKGRPIHLLGGRFKTQLQLIRKMPDNVVSLDNNHISRMAKFGRYFDRQGKEHQLQDHINGYKITRPLMACLALSFDAMREAINDIFSA